MKPTWSSKTLGECVEMISGGTPSKGNARYWGGSVPWLSAKDMKRFFVEDTEDHLSAEGASEATRIVPAGTTLVLTRGMTLLNDVPICVAGRPFAFNQDVKALIPRRGVEASFVPYLLLSLKPQLLSAVDLAGHGTGRLNSDTLKSFNVLLPPPTEQRAFAGFLGALDDKIELNRRMNGTLEAMARAIFKSWFVDFDPVRAKAEGRPPAGMDAETAALFPDSFEEAQGVKIPRDWRPAPLDEVADFRNGLAMQRFPATDGGYLPVIKIAELNRGDTYGADRASASLDPLYVVDDGDLLFSWSGSLVVRIWCGGRGALNQHLFKVTSASFPKWFYYCWLLEHLPGFQLIAAGKATTMGHIQRHHLHDASVVVPPQRVLDRASQLLEPMLERVVANNVESRTLAAVRDALLPKLLSGEVRVQPAEGAALARA